jgi:uncharacterized protein (DUF58 family)
MTRRLEAVLDADGERPPHEPGPGPIPSATLRSLELRVRRAIHGLAGGDHPTATGGDGLELARIRPYVPGDDVRRLEWNASARTGMPHVRVPVAERALTTWVALDRSPSMAFGTASRRKADVAEGVALVLGYLATRRANRLGVIAFGDGSPARVHPPRSGRGGLLALRSELAPGTGRAPAPGEPRPGPTRLGEALELLAAGARSRGLVAIVSDFRGPRDWERPMASLAGRHGVLAIEVRDPREQRLPDVGDVRLLDPETGRQIRVDTRSRRLRERFAVAADRERAEIARALARCGARHHVVLSTRDGWLGTLAAALERARRAR